jgi:four helix bundle protein
MADSGSRKEGQEMPFRFESLDIWHSVRKYAGKVYAVTAKFPRHEDYGLRSQMNRAVNSISLNIAEGGAKSTVKAFDYQLEVAVASTFEGVGASFLALDGAYTTGEDHKELYEHGEQLAKSINAFRNPLP